MDLHQRASGILLHVTSLPGPHGIGDLGPGAGHFVDWLAASGQRLWQILPITPIGPGDSPYQSGNNNAYSQDNDVSWVDWGLARQNAELLRFTRLLIAFRRTQPALRRAQFDGEGTGITFHGVELHRPDLSWESRSLALFFPAVSGEAGDHVYVITNAFWEPLVFELPRLSWRRVVDTSLAPPDDVAPAGAAPALDDYSSYPAAPRSVVVLAAPRPR